MFGEEPASLGGEREALLATNRGLLPPEALTGRRRHERADRLWAAIVPEGDKGEVRAGGVLEAASGRIAGLDPDPDLHRGPPDVVDHRAEVHDVADPDGEDEVEGVHRRGHAGAPRVLHRGERRADIDPRHDLPAEDGPERVRVGRQHELVHLDRGRQRRAGLGGLLRGVVHSSLLLAASRDVRRGMMGQNPAIDKDRHPSGLAGGSARGHDRPMFERPTAHRLVTPDGFGLAWYRWGDPSLPPVIFAHGFLDCALSFDPVARILSDEWCIIAPDHRGHGVSDRVGPGGYYHFPDYVRDLAALLDVVAPGGSVALVGHSMGASIAVYLAGALPDRVHALALLDGLGPSHVEPAEGPRLMRRWLSDLGHHARRDEPAMEDLETVAKRLARTAPFAPPDRLLELARHAAVRGEDGLFRWRFDPLHRTRGPTPFDVHRFHAFLRAITCPVLVLRGERSPMWEKDADARLASLSRVEVDTLAGAGHNLHHERPHELAAHLSAFLRRAPAPSRPKDAP
jgi:pimeloyl-ACP methyl ester carboxylesterase